MKNTFLTFTFKYRFFIFIFFFVLLNFSFLSISNATGIVPCNGLACKFCDLFTLFSSLINAAIEICIALAVMFIVYGGFLILTSNASPSNLSKGKTAIWSAIIGLAVLLSAWLIVDSILKFLVGRDVITSEWGPWNSLTCAP